MTSMMWVFFMFFLIWQCFYPNGIDQLVMAISGTLGGTMMIIGHTTQVESSKT